MPKIAGWSRKQELESSPGAQQMVWKNDNRNLYVALQRSRVGSSGKKWRGIVLTKREVKAYHQKFGNRQNVIFKEADKKILNGEVWKREVTSIECPTRTVGKSCREEARERTVSSLKTDESGERAMLKIKRTM